ncbi:MAG: hypothetical protein F6K30_11515, partial [Cyanothece sp. SIO2G6]|nr:hypothetical protein [Cyanothece sp. SIO2G6]
MRLLLSMAVLPQLKSRFVSPNVTRRNGQWPNAILGGVSLSVLAGTVVGTVAIATLSTLSTALPSLAADPFRTENPHTIDDQTEQAFNAMFR